MDARGRAAAAAVTMAALSACTQARSVSPFLPKSERREPAAGALLDQARALGYVASGVPAKQAEAATGETAMASMNAALKLIRTAQLAVHVGDFDAAVGGVGSIAAACGGYLADTRVSRLDSGRRAGEVVVRVRAERFDEAMARLRKLGDVASENVSAQDVTKAYADLETRLRVKRDTAARLREILQVRTAKLADVLEAERELARVTEEIEGLEGERRFYDHQVALSTVTVALSEIAAIATPGFLGELQATLRVSLSALSRSAAGVAYAVAFLVPWTPVLWFGYWVARRSLRRLIRRAARA